VFYCDQHSETFDTIFQPSIMDMDYLKYRPLHYHFLYLFCATNFEPKDMTNREERKEMMNELVQREWDQMEEHDEAVLGLLAGISLGGSNDDPADVVEYEGTLQVTDRTVLVRDVVFGRSIDFVPDTQGYMESSLNAQIRFPKNYVKLYADVLEYSLTVNAFSKATATVMRSLKDWLLKQPFLKVPSRREDVEGRHVDFNSKYWMKWYSCHLVSSKPTFVGFSSWTSEQTVMVDFVADLVDSNGWPKVRGYEEDFRLWRYLQEFVSEWDKKPPDITYLRLPLFFVASLVLWFTEWLDLMSARGYAWFVMREGKPVSPWVVIRITKRYVPHCKSLEIWKRVYLHKTTYLLRFFVAYQRYLHQKLLA